MPSLVAARHRAVCTVLTRPLAWALVAGSLTGCVQYLPVTPESRPDPAGGSAMYRMQLTPAGSAAVAGALGGGVSALSGRLQPLRGDTLVVQVNRSWLASGIDMAHRGTVVTLAPGHVQSTARRQLSVPRTVLLGALIGGGLAILPGIVTGSGSAGGTQGGGPAGTPP